MEVTSKGRPTSKLRFGTTKSRNGCLSCKQRRVKCDESKPSCQRCLKACKPCIWPGPNNVPKGASFVHYVPYIDKSPNQLPEIGMEEKRALSIFREKMAPEAASVFCNKLWSSIIPLMVSYEPAVKHAVVALATVYEQYFTSLYEAQQPASHLALEHYGKAMAQIAKLHDASSTQTIEVTLLGCLLFSSLEVLQGHYNSAMTHITYGLGVLEAHDKDDGIDLDVYVPRNMFRHVFNRIASNCLEIGMMRPVDWPKNLNKCTRTTQSLNFKSLVEATLSLTVIWNRLILLVQNHDLCVIRPDSTLEQQRDFENRRNHVVTSFRDWVKAFDELQLTPEMKTADIAILEIYRVFISILLRVDLKLGQVAFEAYNAEFRDIVILSSMFLDDTSKLIANPASDNSPPKVIIHSSSNGTIPAHYEIHNCHILDMHPSCTPLCTPEEIDHLSQSRLHRPPTPLLPKSGSCYVPSYSSSLGIGTPLFSTIVYCRNYSIRQKAQYLLSIANRKEGVLDSSVAAAVGSRMINIELEQARNHDTDDAAIGSDHAKVGVWWHLKGLGGSGRTAVEVTVSPLCGHKKCGAGSTR